MPRIRLLLGRQHRHRHRFRREQAIQGDSIGSVRQAMPGTLADNGTNPGTPTASDSGCLVDPDSHPVFGRFSVPRKEVMSSVSNAGCLVDPDSHPVFGRFSVPKKEVVSSVSNAVTAPAPQFTFGTLGGPSRSISLHAGLSIGCVSLAMSSPLAYNAKSCGIPFLSLSGLPVGHVSQMSSPLACNAKSFGIPFVSLSVTATDQQFISGSSGGPSRSFSVHAGDSTGRVRQADSYGLHDCPKDHIVEQLPDRVKIGDNQDFKAKMSAEKKRIAANISGFKDRYSKFVKPILASRCLIAPAGLSDPSTVFLHQQTYKIANLNPRYLSIFDVMSYEDGVRDTLEWTQFLEHLTERRVYIIEDIDVEDEEKKDIEDKDIEDKNNKKDLKLSISSIEALLYDHGIKGPHDGMDVDFYKGECDASYVNGKANLSYMIWKDDTIVFSEIYKDISCTSVTEAEVFAAFSLLSKARELRILKLLLCSDCVTISEIISGQLIIDRDHPHRNTYLMLRSMRRHFKNLIATWKPRELMSFVDDLAKSDDRYGSLLFKNLKKKWSSHLKGSPLFRIEWTKSTKATVKNFAKTHVDESFGTNSNSVFFVGVDENIKLDCLIGINESLGPNNLVLYVNNIEDRPQSFIVDLKKVVGKHTETKFGSYSCFTAEHTPQDAVKTLVVVFDAAVPQEIYYHGDKSFHVLFVTDEEMKIVNENNIPKLTALGFVYFNGVKHPLNDPVNKKNGDQTLGEDEEPKLSSVAEGEERQRERSKVCL